MMSVNIFMLSREQVIPRAAAGVVLMDRDVQKNAEIVTKVSLGRVCKISAFIDPVQWSQ